MVTQDDGDNQMYRRGGSTPVPDPTLLTTEALQREIKTLRELMEERITSLRDLMEAKIDEREHISDEKFSSLGNQVTLTVGVMNEKFRSVDNQLELVERQRVEQKLDTKAAVDAALTAQKEAVREQTTASERAIAKSETSTTKQLEQLTTTFNTAISGVTNGLSDVKDRVGKIESIKIGVQEKGAGVNANIGLIISVVVVIIAIVSVLASTFAK